MEALTLTAHFDGTNVVIDETVTLEKDVKLLVTVIPDGVDAEADEWFRFAAASLNSAYGDDEPEYSLDDLIEVNPDFVRK